MFILLIIFKLANIKLQEKEQSIQQDKHSLQEKEQSIQQDKHSLQRKEQTLLDIELELIKAKKSLSGKYLVKYFLKGSFSNIVMIKNSNIPVVILREVVKCPNIYYNLDLRDQ
jgi:hypothetical protein